MNEDPLKQLNEEQLKKNLSMPENWIRAIYMILFFFVYNMLDFLIIIITIFQFVATLMTGKPDNRITIVGKHASNYVFQILLFLTYNTEKKPYPFSAWPKFSDSRDDLIQK